MDEPTVGIDPRLRNHILESVKKLNQEGTSIIYTTHYMEEVEELCNKTPDDMMKVRNLGRKSLEEVLAKLKELGLQLSPNED